jgi:hypothetical protein
MPEHDMAFIVYRFRHRSPTPKETEKKTWNVGFSVRHTRIFYTVIVVDLSTVPVANRASLCTPILSKTKRLEAKMQGFKMCCIIQKECKSRSFFFGTSPVQKSISPKLVKKPLEKKKSSQAWKGSSIL